MATENTLGREVVEIVTKGVIEADRGIDRVKRSLDRVGGSTATANRFIDRMASGLKRGAEITEGFAALVRTFTLGGGLGLGAIARGAMQNTVEADQLSRAWTQLSRVVGDQLAPYVRHLTVGIINLSKWWRTLSQETRASVTAWAALTAAFAATVSLMPLLLRGLASVAAILKTITATLLLNPYVAIPAALAAIGAALIYLSAEGETFADKMVDIAGKVAGAWAFLRAVTMATFEGMIASFKAVTTTIEGLSKVIDRMFRLDFKGAAKAAMDFQLAFIRGVAGHDPGRAWKDQMDRMDDARNKAKKVAKEITDFFKGLGQGGGFNVKVNVGFEGLDDTFRRLQTAFAQQAAGLPVERQQLEEAKKHTTKLEVIAAMMTQVGRAIPAIR